MRPRHDFDCGVAKKNVSVRFFSRCEIDTPKLLKFAIFWFSLFKICLLKLYRQYFLKQISGSENFAEIFLGLDVRIQRRRKYSAVGH